MQFLKNSFVFFAFMMSSIITSMEQDFEVPYERENDEYAFGTRLAQEARERLSLLQQKNLDIKLNTALNQRNFEQINALLAAGARPDQFNVNQQADPELADLLESWGH